MSELKAGLLVLMFLSGVGLITITLGAVLYYGILGVIQHWGFYESIGVFAGCFLLFAGTITYNIATSDWQ